ncbi:MAG: bifunctional hydroxymethylpyrimidine kinase/phosphomethylpyrimidine kinase [Desulfovibrionales bacterium]|nr:bifunctional hydroxymethylpyrimidine kinase/phosphomethylpyrimidine kinase [Desulfovibrionales bacterium]
MKHTSASGGQRTMKVISPSPPLGKGGWGDFQATKIITVAGSDPGGGAGIQADLKTITVLGGYGLSVITALTAQNTRGVQAVHPVLPAFVAAQMKSILSDIGADAVKTGMLANAGIISAVAARLKSCRIRKIVVDPVLLAGGGEALTEPAALPALKAELLPLAYVVTPNLAEAEVLTGLKVKTVSGMEKAARAIAGLGPANILIKGGHLAGDPVDVLFDGEGIYHFRAERVPGENKHGTGCTFSAALATFLAQGYELVDALARAKSFVTLAIRSSFPIGRGAWPANPYACVDREMSRYQVITALEKAVATLKGRPVRHLIPEVQSNLGYALPFAEDEGDVAAIPGRIIGIGDSVDTVAAPGFGASHHMARIILAVMRYDPAYRSAMNIRFGEDIIKKCRQLKWHVASFDRQKEPPDVKRKEGASLRWGIDIALEDARKIPDIIYDCGDVGKEPMIRILGRDPEEVVSKVLMLI